jgi:hypothetical protein
MSDEHAQPTRRECAAVEVGQVESVEPGEVGLYLVSMLIEQGPEVA